MLPFELRYNNNKAVRTMMNILDKKEMKESNPKLIESIQIFSPKPIELKN